MKVDNLTQNYKTVLFSYLLFYDALNFPEKILKEGFTECVHYLICLFSNNTCIAVYAAIGKKPPPAPGCVDQQLTSLTLNSNSVHTELDIPPAPADTPYALQILLDMYRAQFLQMVEIMKSPRYRDDVNLQIERDKVRCKGV